MIGSPAALSAAVSAYGRARSAIAPQDGAGPAQLHQPPSGFSAGDRFMQALEQVDAAATAAMSGAVETHRLVQTIAEAELALESAVAIRDKVVEAYQEILRMPV